MGRAASVTQDDVEEIKVIMLDNMNKADERAGKLGELEDRAENYLSMLVYFIILTVYIIL